MKDHCANCCKASTIAAHEWLMKRFIRPKLGNRKLLELRPADIAKLHADLQDTPYNANRVLGLLRAMLNCAERWEMIPLDVKAIRKGLKLTQQQFAQEFGLELRTIQDWEQGRVMPTGAARTLLRIIERDPEAVRRALA